MDERRFVKPLSDEALAREIEAALAVDPSPEFLARARARVAVEAAPAGWSVRWGFVTAGAAVAAIAVASVVWGPLSGGPGSGGPALEPDSTNAREASVPAAPAVGMPERAPGTRLATPRVLRAVARAAPVIDELPEVIVSDNEVKAFEQLLTRAREGTLEISVPSPPVPVDDIEADGVLTPTPVTLGRLVMEPPILQRVLLEEEGERP